MQLKRAKLPCRDLVLFYITCIRSILTYAVPVFHYALRMYLQRELERVQERALSIICAGLDYKETLDFANVIKFVICKFQDDSLGGLLIRYKMEKMAH